MTIWDQPVGPTYDFDFGMSSNCGSKQALVLFRGPCDFRHRREKRWERQFTKSQTEKKKKKYTRNRGETLGCIGVGRKYKLVSSVLIYGNREKSVVMLSGGSVRWTSVRC